MPEPSAQLEEPIRPPRQSEGLRRCRDCGGIVCRDRQGRKVTPVLGLPHICAEWQALLAAQREARE